MASCARNSKCRVLQARFGGLTGVRPAAHPASLPHFLAASFAPSRRAAYSFIGRPLPLTGFWAGHMQCQESRGRPAWQ